MCPAVDLDEPRFARFEPALNGGTAARRFVADALSAWGCDDLAEDAVLCVSELATNAVLHTRAPFEVGVRRTGDGVRLEVVDSRPEAPPSPVPRHGTAIDVTSPSITGRGLQIIALLASRWGYNVTTGSKSVWAEISPNKPATANPPVIEITHTPDPTGSIHLRFLGIPVRAAIASGVQVEEVVREVQLGLLDEYVTTADKEQLYELLDGSAPLRLEGRHAAFRASADGHTRFDIELSTTPGTIAATREFSDLIEALPGQAELSAAKPTEAVIVFRGWLLEETMWQIGGGEPRPCRLPA